MKQRLLLGALALAAALPIEAQTLQHMRIEAPNAQDLGARLEESGFDVVEGSIQANQLEVIVSDASLAELRALGLSPELIATSRPFREIQAEQMAQAGPDAPPAGYPDLAAVNAQMMAAAAAFPSICQFVDITDRVGAPATVEGRHIFAVKISDNVTQDENEPNFLMVGAHHVREVVTPVICLDAMNRLLNGYGSDPQITNIVDNQEIWIAPVWNPDGYEYVWSTNNFWRKNRRVFSNGVGVDLNRNYAFGWSSACAGSTFAGSDTYKGPSANSENETKTMVLFSIQQHFSKVLDYHSFGRETLWEYGCLMNPLANFMRTEAAILSTQSGYGGSNRPPSANGEHYEWQIWRTGAHSFLTETHTSFQPSFASAQTEAARVWPGSVWFFERGIPVTGNVTDAGTGQNLDADISISGVTFTNGERIQAGGRFGRYHVFVPQGSYDLTFSAAGYQSQTHTVNVTPTGSVSLDVGMVPLSTCAVASTTFRNGSGLNPACLSSLTLPIIGSRFDVAVDATSVGGPSVTVIQGRRLGVPGLPLAFGELLLDLNSPLVFQTMVATTGVAVHEIDVPSSIELSGISFTMQGAVQIGGLFSALCNAEDVTIGCGP